jgi:hypothetical protein
LCSEFVEALTAEVVEQCLGALAPALVKPAAGSTEEDGGTVVVLQRGQQRCDVRRKLSASYTATSGCP